MGICLGNHLNKFHVNFMEVEMKKPVEASSDGQSCSDCVTCAIGTVLVDVWSLFIYLFLQI